MNGGNGSATKRWQSGIWAEAIKASSLWLGKKSMTGQGKLAEDMP